MVHLDYNMINPPSNKRKNQYNNLYNLYFLKILTSLNLYLQINNLLINYTHVIIIIMFSIFYIYVF